MENKNLQDYWNLCMETIEQDFWQDEKGQADRRSFVVGYFTALFDNKLIDQDNYIKAIKELALFDAF